MELKQTALGVVQVLVFFAFQAGVFNSLQYTAWLLGVIIFSVILYLIGRVSMPRRTPPMLEELWKFTIVLAVVLTAIYSLGAPFMASMMPSEMSMAQVTSLTLGFWLVIFGAAMFVTGWTVKWGVTTAVGIVWVFSGVVFAAVTSTYFDFALITGFPFIIYGLITKG
jgi:hypothetical protein